MPEQHPAVRWNGQALELLDQRLLPHKICYITLQSAAEVAGAIKDMVVRGAPAIGITAAYGVVLAARQRGESANWLQDLAAELDLLADARPTAVNLVWAVEGARQMLASLSGSEVPERLEHWAMSIHSDDIAACETMGRFGAELLGERSRVYTHCNAGALATGGYGTALGVIRAGFDMGKVSQVYAGETRPWLQGARLTAWELQQSGIPVTLSTEGAAGSLMRSGAVDWVVVGSDRVAANGDVANKVGTYNLAVLARHHGVKFMVACPLSTIDLACPSGQEIPIEQRNPDEVTRLGEQQIAPDGVTAINPSFDVTPAELVDALVTEAGVVECPDKAGVARLFK